MQEMKKKHFPDPRRTLFDCLSRTVLGLTTSNVPIFRDNSSGQLGVESVPSSALPQAVELRGVVRAVACGQAHTVVLTSMGIFQWGCSVACKTKNDVYLPTVAPLRSLRCDDSGDDQAVDVACGDLHTLVLSRKGWVWAWGCNAQGQLGHTRAQACAQVENVWDVVKIGAGETFSVAVDKTGTLYTWGSIHGVDYSHPFMRGGHVKTTLPQSLRVCEIQCGGWRAIVTVEHIKGGCWKCQSAECSKVLHTSEEPKEVDFAPLNSLSISSTSESGFSIFHAQQKSESMSSFSSSDSLMQCPHTLELISDRVQASEKAAGANSFPPPSDTSSSLEGSTRQHQQRLRNGKQSMDISSSSAVLQTRLQPPIFSSGSCWRSRSADIPLCAPRIEE